MSEGSRASADKACRETICAELREFLPEWNYPPGVVAAICLEIKARGGDDHA